MELSWLTDQVPAEGERARELARSFAGGAHRSAPHRFAIGLRCLVCRRGLVAVIARDHGVRDVVRALGRVTRCPHDSPAPQPVLLACTQQRGSR